MSAVLYRIGAGASDLPVLPVKCEETVYRPSKQKTVIEVLEFLEEAVFQGNNGDESPESVFGGVDPRP